MDVKFDFDREAKWVRSPMDRRADRGQLAGMLWQIWHDRPVTDDDARKRVANFYYAMGIAATLGYKVGVDKYGWGCIQLPVAEGQALNDGMIAFPLGHFEALRDQHFEVSELQSSIVRERVDAFHVAVLRRMIEEVKEEGQRVWADA